MGPSHEPNPCSSTAHLSRAVPVPFKQREKRRRADLLMTGRRTDDVWARAHHETDLSQFMPRQKNWEAVETASLSRQMMKSLLISALMC